jgi:hypothetical protein
MAGEAMPLTSAWVVRKIFFGLKTIRESREREAALPIPAAEARLRSLAIAVYGLATYNG